MTLNTAFIAGFLVLLGNASVAGKSSEVGDLNETSLYKKYRMYLATGKPRNFDTEEELLEAKTILDEKILNSHMAVVGSFDESSKSEFIADNYPGGGYYNFDFHIIDDLKNPNNPVENISVRVPRDFIKLSDQEYLSEIQSTWNELFREATAFKKKHAKGKVTAGELSAYNDEWDMKLSPMKYVYSFIVRIRRGSDFSITGNIYALFLSKAGNSTYVFRPSGIYPIGRGTFVDILRQEQHFAIPDDTSQITRKKYAGTRTGQKDPSVKQEVLPGPGTNLIRNGDFVKDLSKWRIGSIWDSTWISESGMDTQGALRISSASLSHIGGAAAIWQCIQIEEQQLYGFGARYRVGADSTTAGGSRLRLVWYEKNNCSGKSAIGDWATPRKLPGWQTLSVSDTRPVAQATSVLIKLIQSVGGEGEFVTYWDDIYLRPEHTTKKAPENSR